MTTTTRNTHALRAIVTFLDTMSGETMRAADDATLQKFESLCPLWKQLADGELALRARTK
jgi:hypothetical protein